MTRLLLLLFFLLSSFAVHSAQAMTCSSFLSPEKPDYSRLINDALPPKNPGRLERSAFDKALELTYEFQYAFPRNHIPHVFFARIFYRMAQTFKHYSYTNALHSYESIVELSPAGAKKVKASALGKRTLIYIRQTKFDLAQVELDRLFEVSPESPKTYYLQALLQTGRREFDRALESVELALSKNTKPDTTPIDRDLKRDSFLLKVRLLLRTGKNQEALRTIAEVADSVGFLSPQFRQLQSIAQGRVNKADEISDVPDWRLARDLDGSPDWMHAEGLNDMGGWID